MAPTSASTDAADIVIPAKPTINDEFCAGELQYWLREITGAKLPITVDATPSSHVDATPSSRQTAKNLDLREHWEIYLDGHVPGVAFHRVAVDPESSVSSFVECVRTKGALACKAQVREVGSSGMEAIVGVPLEAFKLKEDGKMRLTFVHVANGAKPTFGWYGAFPCQIRHLKSVAVSPKK